MGFFIFIKNKKDNYELSEIEKCKNAIEYWSRMNELTCFNWKYSKKTIKLLKKWWICNKYNKSLPILYISFIFLWN